MITFSNFNIKREAYRWEFTDPLPAGPTVLYSLSNPKPIFSLFLTPSTFNFSQISEGGALLKLLQPHGLSISLVRQSGRIANEITEGERVLYFSQHERGERSQQGGQRICPCHYSMFFILYHFVEVTGMP